MIRLLFLILLLPSLLFGADLYCDYTNGDDANDCTNSSSQLCKTLQRCTNVATRGDTINLADTSAQLLAANYSTASGYNATGSGFLTIQSYDAGGALTIQRPDEASSRVAAVIDGASTYTFVTGQQYFKFKNIRFQNFISAPTSANYSVYEGNEYTSISGTGTGIATLGSVSVFSNNYVHDNTAIDGVTAAYYSVIVNNWFEDNDPSTVFGDRAVLQATYTQNVVSGNIFINNGYKADIKARNGGQAIFNNTFYSLGEASQIGVYDIVNGTSVYDNVFYNYDGASAKPIDTTSSYQHIAGNNSFYDSNTATYATAIAIDLTANDIDTTGDPFVSVAGNDFCVTGTGSEDAAYSLGGLLDIGALECTSGAAPTYLWKNP